MKAVLYVLCALLVGGLVILFLIPNVFNIKRSFGPVLYEVIEEIRCRFEKGVCFSLYPNPAATGSKIGMTVRTQEWYNTQQACFYDVHAGGVMSGRCCTIDNGKCMSNFTAPAAAGSYVYYAFLDVDLAEDLDAGEPRSSDITLRVS